MDIGMTRVIMHGCNGRMGQVISGLAAEDGEVQLVAGVDVFDDGHNPYPVFSNIRDCSLEADCIIDFSTAGALDELLDYCEEQRVPCVLCTTGLSEEQLQTVQQVSERVAVLRSANMSLGVNLLFGLVKKAAAVLAPAGFDMEIVERHHNQKIDAPSGTAPPSALSSRTGACMPASPSACSTASRNALCSRHTAAL